jgi:aryl-alcohol dehydrogenase-like predicted oxidoreductase
MLPSSSKRVVTQFAGTITRCSTDFGDLIVTDSGKELFHLAQTQALRVYEGIGVIVYSPMASGLLAGAMARERIAKLPDDDWRKRRPR